MLGEMDVGISLILLLQGTHVPNFPLYPGHIEIIKLFKIQHKILDSITNVDNVWIKN